ncbi:hypothetical protein SAMN04488096_1025 [Mesonia phycicola]|uniref:Uncharacterized protein n=1 Tax=Mesonia phycicola TaxID=579105 RepID=A0A1M6BEZ2_9FLAO|nr:hypothetical protein [Mesonia phycicola]SHI47256.1 hypothetical protein SAMN04488096_1025 [Mesonia phycicola]
MCPADTDAKASKLALFTIFTPNLPLAGKLYKTVVKHLKKILNISFKILAFLWILFIGFGIIGTQFFGETSDDLGFNKDQNHLKKEIINNKQNQKFAIQNTDSIPQGKFKYEIYLAEFGGRMQNETCDIEIKGNKVIITQNKTNDSERKTIFSGMVLKHNSGKWVLADNYSARNAEEIGGCTTIPIIDFKKKLIEWC